MSKFIYLECRIGKLIGISDSLIKKARREFLVSGEDFGKVDGRIAYSELAVNTLFDGLLNCGKTSAGTKSKAQAANLADILTGALIEGVSGEKQAVTSSTPWTFPAAVLIVNRIFAKNSQTLQASLHPDWIEEHGEAYQRVTGIDPAQKKHRIGVRKGYADRFTIGMEVPCTWKQADLWTCARAMPRRKGRWN